MNVIVLVMLLMNVESVVVTIVYVMTVLVSQMVNRLWVVVEIASVVLQREK